jgi:hypothetical protein
MEMPDELVRSSYLQQVALEVCIDDRFVVGPALEAAPRRERLGVVALEGREEFPRDVRQLGMEEMQGRRG